MGFFLDYLEFQGSEKCPQYLWKQLIHCEDQSLLEEFRSKQANPSSYRIYPDAAEVQRMQEQETQTKTKGDTNGIES